MTRLLLVGLLLTAGCALQVGKHGGTTPTSPVRVVHGGHIAAYTAPWRPGGVGFPHVGVELAGEVEHQVEDVRDTLGTTWTAGLQAGWTYWFEDSRISLQPHANVGTAFPGGPYDGYAGATFAMPIDLGPNHNVTDMNHAFQFVARRLSVVPYLRWRTHWTDDAGHHNASAGVAFRARLSTDLL